MEDIQNASHILDPIDGYRLVQEEDDLRVSFRRIELGAILVTIVTLVQAAGNVVHGVILLWILIGVALCGSGIFWWAARRAQRRVAFRVPYLNESFAVFAMMCSSCAGWIAGLEGYVTSGYSLAALCCALFLMVPTRRFVGIAIATYAFFVIWSLLLDVPFFTTMYSITNTGFSVLVACFGRAGIERIQHLGRQQRIQIAQQNNRLSQANRALESRNEELNDLMAIAAHDLRSPLYGLRNLLQLASERPPRSAKAWEKLLTAAGGGVDSMQHLISRILQAHEVEAGTAIELVPVNILEAVRRAAARHHSTAERHDIELRLDLPEEPIFALSNWHALEQILDNLISNAVRFSPGGSSVDLTVDLEQSVSIEICDHGVGLDEQALANLFRKFGRGEHRPLNGNWGSGMGLFIVKTLAQSVRANVTYAPTPGGGSTFRIILPVAP